MGFIEEDSFRDEKGRLLPGHKGLKKLGSTNRLQGEIKEKLTQFLAGELESIEAIYKEVSPKDKLRFIGELLSYVLPKSKELINITEPQTRINYSALSDSALQEILNNTINEDNNSKV